MKIDKIDNLIIVFIVRKMISTGSAKLIMVIDSIKQYLKKECDVAAVDGDGCHEIVN